MRQIGRRGSTGRAHVGRAAVSLGVASAVLILAAAPGLAASSAAAPAKRDPSVKVDYSVPQPPLPPVGVPFVIANAATGDVIAERDAHKRMPPASTLKMLTALALLPNLDPRKVITATYGESSVEGTRVGLVAGEKYHISDLFYGMFLASGNDASLALSRANGGDKVTVAEMNQIAKQIGATDTLVVNPDGLDAKGQLSSAHDLCIFAREGLKRPDFASYVATKWVKFPGRSAKKKGQHRQTFQVWNINRFMQSGYRGAIGVKSGYTTHAHNTLAIAATRGSRTYIVTLMGIQGNSYKYGIALMNWAFKNGAKVKPVDTLLPPPPTPSPSPTIAPASHTDDAAIQASGQQSKQTSVGSSFKLPMPIVALWGVVTAIVIGVLVMRRRDQAADFDE
jgi:serine-type D-Ala-D-Ala carboxypeptidase (penicillin-binding protein 5/6)